MAKLKREKLDLSQGKNKLKRPPKGMEDPNFHSLFDGTRVPDPLANTEYTGDPQQDTANEISDTLKALKEAKRERYDAYRTLVDTEYYFVAVFQNREQKEVFLSAIGMIQAGDKYIDGLLLAQKLGVEIEPIHLPKKTPHKAAKLLRNTPIIDAKPQS